MNALEFVSVKKSFGSTAVISNLNFQVPINSILGFLGKNGAGKTTTMKMILGFLKIDDGYIKVFGEKVKYGITPTNRNIGYLPDIPEFYGYMTAKEYLHLCGEITSSPKEEILRRTDELLHLVGLENNSKRIEGFSRGMKQRLGIAQALLNSPKLLICDEPTSALDPVGRKEILDILLKLKRKTTILFSTHILSDVESICDQVVILDKGMNVLSGEIDKIKQLKRSLTIEIKFSSDIDKNVFMNSPITKQFQVSEERNNLVISIADESIKNKIMNELCHLDIFPEEMRIIEPSLEDIFMEATKQ